RRSFPSLFAQLLSPRKSQPWLARNHRKAGRGEKEVSHQNAKRIPSAARPLFRGKQSLDTTGFQRRGAGESITNLQRNSDQNLHGNRLVIELRRPNPTYS